MMYPTMDITNIFIGRVGLTGRSKQLWKYFLKLDAFVRI